MTVIGSDVRFRRDDLHQVTSTEDNGNHTESDSSAVAVHLGVLSYIRAQALNS